MTRHILWSSVVSILFVISLMYADDSAYKRGVSDGRFAISVIANEQLVGSLVKYNEALKDSHQESDRLQALMQQQANQDQKTTEELRNALAQTSSLRVDCRLPDDIMQQLKAARDRANTARTQTDSSSTQPAMPSTARAEL